MTLKPGTRLGAYEIIALLGAGGMGEVYRARDSRLGREIAIKVLPAEVASSPERLARFEREARAVAALNHPSIVTLHSIDEAEGVRFLTMELIDGSTLQDHVKPGGLPIGALLDLALPLVDALVAAHASGVVHRDLKPGNVMVARDGRVKVLDFGLAKNVPDEPGAALGVTLTSPGPLTDEGRVMGTAPYMSPEQIRGEVVDFRSDLFSLGVLLYELATGVRPFRAPTAGALATAILRDPPVPLSTARPDAPAALGEIVARCLEKDVARRYQMALEVRSALQALQRTLAPSPAERAADAPSIAVLPFANMSADPENEYFSDGLAEELLNVLTKTRDLKVIGRTSSFAFKGRNEDLRHIGQRLGVTTLLEGSVRKAGNRVRITAQLVNAADGFHLWSETYDRVLDDIFAVQDEIARAVSAALQVRLLGGRRAGPQTSGRSFERVLRANHFFIQNTAAAIARAVDLYQEAIDESPDDAVAWAGLAKARSFQAGYGYADQGEARREARRAVERALELDPHLADAHVVLALVLGYLEFRWPEALDAAERALSLAPSSSETMVVLSGYLGIRGRLGEGLALARRAAESDPLNPAVLANLAKIEGWAGNSGEALDATLRTLEISPAMTSMRASLGLSYVRLRRAEEGMAEVMKETSKGYRDHGLAIAYHLVGNRGESDAALARLASMGEEWACQVAFVHAARGERDEAFRWLYRAAELRDPGVATVHLTSHTTSLRDDPRWAPFLRKVGLVR